MNCWNLLQYIETKRKEQHSSKPVYNRPLTSKKLARRTLHDFLPRRVELRWWSARLQSGGRGLDSQGRTITQGIKIIEKWKFFLSPANSWTFTWLRWLREIAVPSPEGDVKMAGVISWYFRAKYIDTEIDNYT